jgi:tRNA (adenine57-N1/adenine58-N1)-methyltransferase catalytic subunit
VKVLLKQTGEHILVKDTSKDYHCKDGYVKKKDLAKKKGRILTNKDVSFFITPPSFADLFNHLKRGAQIIRAKDAAMILAYTGVGKQSSVIDCGAGSGALACFLGYHVKKVVTYDNDERSIKVVKDNIAFLGLKNVKLKKGDVYGKFRERNADLFTLDVPAPWDALHNAHACLKPGGYLVSYSPQITQAQMTVIAGSKLGFTHTKTIELLEREWVIDEKRARPEYRMMGHTGFLSFLRKLE